MAEGLSTTNTANAWLNVFRGGGNGVTFTAPSTIYIELHTANPGAAGTTAVSAGSTTRLAATFNAASSGALALTASVGPWTNGGTSETITDIAVWSASSAGTFYWSAPLTTNKTWASGDTLTLNTCGLSLTPLAS